MPTHEFVLLHENGNTYGEYMNHIHDPAAIKLDDDLVLYIIDTLSWIPTINPANPAEWLGHGLNYYGPTVINKSGADKAARIFRFWASLMKEGPERLELTGRFEWANEESPNDGRYAKISAERESVVSSFEAIAEFAEQVATGNFFMLHLGI